MAAHVHPKDLGKDRYTSNGGDIFKYVELTPSANRSADSSELTDRKENQPPSLTKALPTRKMRTSKHIMKPV